MKSIIFTTGIICALSLSSKGQLNYTFSTTTQTYTPLTGTTSVNGSTVWDEESYQFAAPFTYKFNNASLTTINLIGGNVMATDTNSNLPTTGFATMGADIWDRANFTGSLTPQSPLRYAVTGTAPNRIFKYEMYNVGFPDENYTYGTNNDSASLQVWIYETSNIVEIHIGDASVTHMSDYFLSGKPFFGYVKNVNLNTASVDMLYYLDGNPASPTLDSTNTILGFTGGLDTWPASGTVYRFTPKPPTTVSALNGTLQGISIYPTAVSNELYVKNTETATVQYSITDISGRIVAAPATLANGTNTIPTSELAPGMYIFHAQNANGTRVLRFTKQ